MSFRIAIAVAFAAAATAVLLPGAATSRAAAQQNELVGSVGPGFTISFRTSGGERVTHLDAGAYTITVNDQSSEHNFHLMGPGVDQATDVDAIGTVTWNVTFGDGSFHYQCDPHQADLKGDFTTGNVQPPPPPPPPPPAPGKAKKLTGSVGPGYTISLKTAGGKRAARVKAGTYRITVRDRSSIHNFHLTGPGVSKSTLVRFKGTKTWTVRIQKGKTYRYRCDPHASRMKGSFKGT